MIKESIITKLEGGRAEFAYKCAKQGKEIIKKTEIEGKYYEDNKYKSYVKKLPSMILTSGLGQTLAFIVSKKQKEKNKQPPGTEENPKNAYDLIYQQLTEYLKSETSARISMPKDKTDLVEWVISLNSQEYRYVTEEVLAFLNWLQKFAEGMIETEEEGEK